MSTFLKFGTFLFHWILMVVLASILFFVKTPQYIPANIIQAKLLAVVILSVFIPVIFYFLLKNLNLIQDYMLSSPKERQIPIVFFGICLLTILTFVINTKNFLLLRDFFWGYLGSLFIALTLTWRGRNINLNALGLSALIGFCFSMNLIFQSFVNFYIAFGVLGLCWTLSIQLSKEKKPKQFIRGILAGILPQLIIFIFFLH